MSIVAMDPCVQDLIISCLRHLQHASTQMLAVLDEARVFRFEDNLHNGPCERRIKHLQQVCWFLFKNVLLLFLFLFSFFFFFSFKQCF